MTISFRSENLRRGAECAALACLLALCAQVACPARENAPDGAGLAVKWELAGNTPATTAAFTIRNKSGSALPAGWRLYFTSAMGISTAGVAGGFNIEHVNGDIYRIFPDAAFSLLPGAAARITYNYDDPVLNCSAAPAGMYLVRDSAPDKGYPVEDFVVAPIKDPSAGFITPAQIYARNSLIKDIPAADLPAIFPTPAVYTALKGEFLLGRKARICADAALRAEAEYLADELAPLLGGRPRIVAAGNGADIVLGKAAMGAEAYRLAVSPGKIEITASGPAGAFYGIQSLKSLMPPTAWAGTGTEIRIPAADVRDAPRFGYRGLLLDVARNFKKKEQVLKVLDLMSLYKLNVLHFHIIDDEGWRLEIPGLPELTEVGARRGHTADGKKMLPPSYGAGPEPGRSLASGYYTRADFIEILKYAARRHIAVIPEIESPGHSRAAIRAMDARYERLRSYGKSAEAEQYLLRDLNDASQYRTAQGWNDNVMCVALPSTYSFMEKVIGEIQGMYKEAGAPLDTIHLGGDEVPAGAWEKSPAILALMAGNPGLKTVDDLWYYYFGRMNAMLKKRGLFLSGWEEAGLRKVLADGKKQIVPNPDFANENFRLHVWNNVIGWGAEDLPYRLANAGYKVVLSCVGNNYFDLAYVKSPDEPGYYWGGYVDVDKPFYFIPYDYYRSTRENAAGDPADLAYFNGKERLTDYGRSNIAGIQGLLWGENIKNNESLEYMILPKLLGLAERAWAQDPQWAVEKDTDTARELYDQAWSVFVNTVGKRELPRLDRYHGGFAYRIPPAGAAIEDGKVFVNIQLPGFDLRYTSDGSEPTARSGKYTGPITGKGLIKIKAFNALGRGGKTTTIENF